MSEVQTYPREDGKVVTITRYPDGTIKARVTDSSRATDCCPDHRPVQHRDGKPPWCKTCGLTARGTRPIGRLDPEALRSALARAKPRSTCY